MYEQPFEKRLDKALDTLRQESGADPLDRFEAEVWSEIAIRDGQARSGWLSRVFEGGLAVRASAVATVCALAIAAGSALAFSQAETYRKDSDLAMEQRYIESIHPVWMSANHRDHEE